LVTLAVEYDCFIDSFTETVITAFPADLVPVREIDQCISKRLKVLSGDEGILPENPNHETENSFLCERQTLLINLMYASQMTINGLLFDNKEPEIRLNKRCLTGSCADQKMGMATRW
jgi:dTDP-4-dehydrorhamnose 3,5-epimerase-like enzyme